MNLTDWVGATGVFFILLAYFLNLADILKNNDIIFLTLNLIGAILACFASILLRYLPFIVLETIWSLVSVYFIAKYFFKNRSKSSQGV